MAEIPQTHDLAGVGYTTMLTPSGEMVLSEHSLIEVQALADRFKKGDINGVYFAGEKTFGVENPSTSLLAADTLVELGMPASRIHISDEGLDYTEAQIIWLAQQNPEDLELLALTFHLFEKSYFNEATWTSRNGG